MGDSEYVQSHILACVGEECGEIQQIVGKSLRFGILDYHPKTGEQNWSELKKEVHDLVAVYQMLCNNMGEAADFDKGMIRAKKKKTIQRMKTYGELK